MIFVSKMTPEDWDAVAARQAAEKEREARGLVAAEAAAKAKALRETGIPAKDRDRVSVGTLDTTPATEALAGGDVLICLSGNPGCGKTTAAAAWLWSYLSDSANWTRDHRQLGTPSIVSKFPLPMFIKAARLSRWQRYDAAEMDKLLKASRLVIDDLGVEFQDEKGNFMAILDEVIDVRYDESRPTVVTTNLDAEAFKLRYGERIADRIRECGRFVSLGNKSLRVKP